MTTALLLPGMSLNRTALPELPCPTLAVDFNDLVLGPAGESSELLARRMSLYVDLLDQRLAAEPAWVKADRRIVVAHSFGGMLALAWWLAHRGEGPARIHGMVLIGTTCGPMYDVVRLQLVRAGPLALRIPLATLIRAWNIPAVTRRVKRLLSDPGQPPNTVDFRTLRHPSDWTMDLAGWRNTDWRAMRSYRLAMDGFDVRERLREVTVPVIVLYGTRDTLFPLRVGQDLARGLPRAELRVVTGAGHALPLTHGAAVQEAVRDLLAGGS